MTGVKVGNLDIQFDQQFDRVKANQLVQALQQVIGAINTLAKQASTPLPPITTVPKHELADNEGLGSSHTTSGLVAGEVLRAVSDSQAAFARLKFGDLAQSDIGENPTNLQIIQFLNGYWTAVDPSNVGMTLGVNIGTGAGVYAGTDSGKLAFKSIQGDGATIEVDSDSTTVTLSFIGAPARAPVITRVATFVNSLGITIPINDVFLDMATAGTIIAVRLLTQGGPGNCEVDLWKAPFASFPPVLANSITAADLPTITAGDSYEDTLLTGWTTAVAAGDVIAVHLDSVLDFTVVSLQLEIQPA